MDDTTCGLLNYGATQMCNMQSASDSADDSARHWQNQEKGKNATTELNIFLSIFFADGENEKQKNTRSFHCYFIN